MKINFNRKTLWFLGIALICLGITFFLLQQTGIGNFGNTSGKEYSGEIDDSLDFSGKDFESIEIKAAGSNVYILPADGHPRIEFKGSFNSKGPEYQPTMEQTVSGKKILIEVTYPKGLFGSSVSVDARLTVYLPEEGLTELSVATASGNIYGEHLSPTKGIFESRSGKIELKSISGRILARTSSGDMDIDFENLNSTVYMESLKGNLNITVPPDAAFTLKTETVSGDLAYDVPLTLKAGKDDNILADVLGGGPMIELKTVSGNLLIH